MSKSSKNDPGKSTKLDVDEKSETLKVRRRLALVELDDSEEARSVSEIPEETDVEPLSDEKAMHDYEKSPSADEKAKRRAELLAELAALDEPDSDEAPDTLPSPDASTENTPPEDAAPSPDAALTPEASPEAGPEGEDPQKRWERMLEARRRRLASMGLEKAEVDEAIESKSVLCAIERKLLPNAEPCAWCRGGCVPEGKELPGLLDVEGVAEELYNGTVVQSGYDNRTDMFVIDLRRKDGKTIEVYFTGDGEPSGWLLLKDVTDSGHGEKSAESYVRVISMDQAQEIALKQVKGIAMGVTPAVFEGYDSWVVEIESPEGKSVDAYVALDGTLLGFDEYEDYEDASSDPEVKELYAELAIKQSYSADRRDEMSKMGFALPDGSFPIANREDVMNAVKAFGRATNPDLAKAHIMKRAVELGADDLIPEEWLAEEDKPAAPAAKEKPAPEGKELPSSVMVGGVEDPSLLMDLVEFSLLEDELGFKREFSMASRERHAEQGHALPDGSYPIVNREDLQNAIQAFGRAKNPAAVKKHIMKRAADLGATDLIPESWMGSKASENAEEKENPDES